MDFLQTPRHRWIYVALFGVMVVFAIETIESLNAPLDADGLIPRLLVKFSKLIKWDVLYVILIHVLNTCLYLIQRLLVGYCIDYSQA